VKNHALPNLLPHQLFKLRMDLYSLHLEPTKFIVCSVFLIHPQNHFPLLAAPNPKEFVFEPGSGYFFDNKTGFYMDPNSGYYFDPGTKEWNFWSPLYNTYIPCEGGNIEWKKSLQILEKEEEFLRMSRSKSPTTMVKIFEQFQDYTVGVTFFLKITIFSHLLNF
jgi:hypothetical protein